MIKTKRCHEWSLQSIFCCKGSALWAGKLYWFAVNLAEPHLIFQGLLLNFFLRVSNCSWRLWRKWVCVCFETLNPTVFSYMKQASLRRSNHKLGAEVEDWQDKFRTLSQHYSGLEDLACHTENSSNRRSSSKPCHNVRTTGPKSDSSRNTLVKEGCRLPSPRKVW